MARYVAILITACLLVGCRAPTPSFNVLAPYGSPTVPPPRTGTVGTAGQYYAPTAPAVQSPAAPPATLPATAPVDSSQSFPAAPPAATPPAAPPVSYMGAVQDGLTDQAVPVAQASYELGSTGADSLPAAMVSDDPLPIDTLMQADEPTASSPSTLQLAGMRVNDATQLAEPRPFTPTEEPVRLASRSTTSASTPSFLRFISPKAGISSQTPASAQSPAPSSEWQSR